MRPPSIAIIGAGFSGSLLALHLSGHHAPATRIQLIEQAPEFGRGLAYSTSCSDHILNVPAGRMSAFHDRPLHFLDWLNRQPDDVHNARTPDSGAFVRRRLYGDYVKELLADAARTAPPGRLELVRGEVIAITRDPEGLTLHFSGGRSSSCAIAVLATGHNIPADPCPAMRGKRFYQPDPWDFHGIEDALPPDRAVLLIGTGLTMTDTVLRLLAHGHQGPIHAISRRGLLPRTHAVLPTPAPIFDPAAFPRQPRALLRFVRREAERIAEAGYPWHAVIDALRPITQDIWRGWPAAERRRFLTHVRPWWDVHRHRMANSIASRIEVARASGQLRIHAGRIAGFVTRSDAVDIAWRPRGAATAESLRVHRVINCTGPDTDVAKASDPLTRSLLLGGLGRPDTHCLGFDVTGEGALRGCASDRLFGVGPICRGALWEITAVPEIRAQCQALARHIAALSRQPETLDWPPVHPPSPPAAAPKISGFWF